MPNFFAYSALFSWPVVVFFLFRFMTRPQALVASILGGYLLLPFGVSINLPVLPTLDKTLIPALSAGVMLLSAPRSRRRLAQIETRRSELETTAERADGVGYRRPKARIVAGPAIGSALLRSEWIERTLIALMFVTPFLTVLQNGEPYTIGFTTLPGLQVYDAFSLVLSALVSILPYLLGRYALAKPEIHVVLLRGLVVAGLLYSLPALFEVRMSPQLSRWIYGFLAQSFAQTVRDGSFRPVVFLQHGLWLATFLAMTFLAALALWRRPKAEGKWLAVALWLFATLVLCHSLGALAIAVVLAPALLFLPVRGQMILASSVAFVILLYPMLRGADLIPVDQLTEISNSISQDRAGSLEFRLKNEDILLAHARVKPLAGWGGWGRSRVYDQVTGGDISVTDGMWIITIGSSGWLGYIAQFGLLTAPLFLLTLNRRQLQVTNMTSGLSLIFAANLMDMILNATLTPVTWLIAGSLMGQVNATGRTWAKGTQTLEPDASATVAARRDDA